MSFLDVPAVRRSELDGKMRDEAADPQSAFATQLSATIADEVPHLAVELAPADGRHTEDYSFTITPTLTEKTRVSLTVPSGYSKALVLGTTTLSAYNSTTSDDNLYAHCAVQGVTQGSPPGTSVKTLYTGAVTSSTTRLLTGISGTISVAGFASTFSGTWSGSTAGNIMNVSALAMFLR